MAVNGRDMEVITPLSSPRNKVKFLCSHGGKILPTSIDGQLKYVGGETRVVSVLRDISFSELMKKLNTLSNGEMVLKYQVIPEDLDILVSVTCDEDLQNMFNEYDRWESKHSESGNTPRLRSFLFPINQNFTHNQNIPNNNDKFHMDQRYIDAINGCKLNRSTSNSNRSIFSISSNGSSPRSIQHEGYHFDNINNNHEGFIPNGYQNSCNKEFHRVSSSPTLYNLGNPNHHYHPNQQNPYYHQSLKKQNSYRGGGGGQRLVTALSVGQNELGRFQLDPIRYYSPSSRPQKGSWGFAAGYGNVDEYCKNGSSEISDGTYGSPETNMEMKYRDSSPWDHTCTHGR